MATASSTQPITDTPTQELGFSISQGVNWSDYITYRPIYPTSFFERIYSYHAQKPGSAWSVAHDVGAGCGIVSSILATRFDNVIVSDPNDGYAALARKLLVEEASLPESKFRFLQETAEKSSLESGTVDLITACECIHWTTPDDSIKDFGRELKTGGTLVITYYTRPLIEASERTVKAWLALWAAFSQISRGGLYDKAYYIGNNGLDSLEFPEERWERVKRVYINAQGTLEAFAVNDRVGGSMVKEGEERVWVEDDEDWRHMHGIEWFKAYLATWMPTTPVSALQGFWDELELALEGKEVRTRTPLAMVFATKKA
ncbi:S-adenosyl-L-methionine-dependent methyltransferase [Hypoxylon rubiginosum]|uniref:S-adenosyl-L-methionine-dependent methyltransferase n=1 Tax=Hypoxylon rubiginosum TaxID=110542 RepID=A0ACB9ZGN4_9PEZI|nr:S-adenosyl-L-methionine-dependent methyltransferase [Hypoxylon rubiginosum]